MESNKKYIVFSLLLATFLTAIEGTIVSTAMPTIVGDLKGIQIMNWVFAIYLLTSAITVPIFGKLSDIYGRKRIFIIGTIVFLIGSSLCGLAMNMGQLILFRALQGIGAGAITPVTMTIIGDLYTYENRAKILGWMSMVWGIAGILGPLVGGFFTDQLSWHWIFFINVPFGILSIFLVSTFFKEKVEVHKKKIDYLGALVFSISMLSLFYGIQKASDTGEWLSFTVVFMFIVFLVSLSVFIWIEKVAEDPLIPLHLFRIREISAANALGFFASVILIGLMVYIPMWIQGIHGYGATVAGFVITPMSILWVVGSFLAGRFLTTRGVRFTSFMGGLFIFIAVAILATIKGSSTLLWFYLATAIVGLGFGLLITVTSVSVQSAVDWAHRGVATASNTFFRTLGQTIGVAILGTLFNSITSARLAEESAGKDIDMSHLNQLINPHTASEVSKDSFGILQGSLEYGIHNVFLILVCITVFILLLSRFMPGLKRK